VVACSHLLRCPLNCPVERHLFILVRKLVTLTYFFVIATIHFFPAIILCHNTNHRHPLVLILVDSPAFFSASSLLLPCRLSGSPLRRSPLRRSPGHLICFFPCFSRLSLFPSSFLILPLFFPYSSLILPLFFPYSSLILLFFSSSSSRLLLSLSVFPCQSSLISPRPCPFPPIPSFTTFLIVAHVIPNPSYFLLPPFLLLSYLLSYFLSYFLSLSFSYFISYFLSHFLPTPPFLSPLSFNHFYFCFPSNSISLH
jgi:hypothetical protein